MVQESWKLVESITFRSEKESASSEFPSVLAPRMCFKFCNAAPPVADDADLLWRVVSTVALLLLPPSQTSELGDAYHHAGLGSAARAQQAALDDTPAPYTPRLDQLLPALAKLILLTANKTRNHTRIMDLRALSGGACPLLALAAVALRVAVFQASRAPHNKATFAVLCKHLIPALAALSGSVHYEGLALGADAQESPLHAQVQSLVSSVGKVVRECFLQPWQAKEYRAAMYQSVMFTQLAIVHAVEHDSTAALLQSQELELKEGGEEAEEDQEDPEEKEASDKEEAADADADEKMDGGSDADNAAKAGDEATDSAKEGPSAAEEVTAAKKKSKKAPQTIAERHAAMVKQLKKAKFYVPPVVSFVQRMFDEIAELTQVLIMGAKVPDALATTCLITVHEGLKHVLRELVAGVASTIDEVSGESITVDLAIRGSQTPMFSFGLELVQAVAPGMKLDLSITDAGQKLQKLAAGHTPEIVAAHLCTMEPAALVGSLQLLGAVVQAIGKERVYRANEDMRPHPQFSTLRFITMTVSTVVEQLVGRLTSGSTSTDNAPQLMAALCNVCDDLFTVHHVLWDGRLAQLLQRLLLLAAAATPVDSDASAVSAPVAALQRFCARLADTFRLLRQVDQLVLTYIDTALEADTEHKASQQHAVTSRAAAVLLSDDHLVQLRQAFQDVPAQQVELVWGAITSRIQVHLNGVQSGTKQLSLRLAEGTWMSITLVSEFIQQALVTHTTAAPLRTAVYKATVGMIETLDAIQQRYQKAQSKSGTTDQCGAYMAAAVVQLTTTANQLIHSVEPFYVEETPFSNARQELWLTHLSSAAGLLQVAYDDIQAAMEESAEVEPEALAAVPSSLDVSVSKYLTAALKVASQSSARLQVAFNTIRNSMTGRISQLHAALQQHAAAMDEKSKSANKRATAAKAELVWLSNTLLLGRVDSFDGQAMPLVDTTSDVDTLEWRVQTAMTLDITVHYATAAALSAWSMWLAGTPDRAGTESAALCGLRESIVTDVSLGRLAALRPTLLASSWHSFHTLLLQLVQTVDQLGAGNSAEVEATPRKTPKSSKKKRRRAASTDTTGAAWGSVDLAAAQDLIGAVVAESGDAKTAGKRKKGGDAAADAGLWTAFASMMASMSSAAPASSSSAVSANNQQKLIRLCRTLRLCMHTCQACGSAEATQTHQDVSVLSAAALLTHASTTVSQSIGLSPAAIAALQSVASGVLALLPSAFEASKDHSTSWASILGRSAACITQMLGWSEHKSASSLWTPVIGQVIAGALLHADKAAATTACKTLNDALQSDNALPAAQSIVRAGAIAGRLAIAQTIACKHPAAESVSLVANAASTVLDLAPGSDFAALDASTVIHCLLSSNGYWSRAMAKSKNARCKQNAEHAVPSALQCVRDVAADMIQATAATTRALGAAFVQHGTMKSSDAVVVDAHAAALRGIVHMTKAVTELAATVQSVGPGSQMLQTPTAGAGKTHSTTAAAQMRDVCSTAVKLASQTLSRVYHMRVYCGEASELIAIDTVVTAVRAVLLQVDAEMTTQLLGPLNNSAATTAVHVANNRNALHALRQKLTTAGAPAADEAAHRLLSSLTQERISYLCDLTAVSTVLKAVFESAGVRKDRALRDSVSTYCIPALQSLMPALCQLPDAKAVFTTKSTRATAAAVTRSLSLIRVAQDTSAAVVLATATAVVIRPQLVRLSASDMMELLPTFALTGDVDSATLAQLTGNDDAAHHTGGSSRSGAENTMLHVARCGSGTMLGMLTLLYAALKQRSKSIMPAIPVIAGALLNALKAVLRVNESVNDERIRAAVRASAARHSGDGSGGGSGSEGSLDAAVRARIMQTYTLTSAHATWFTRAVQEFVQVRMQPLSTCLISQHPLQRLHHASCASYTMYCTHIVS